MDLKYAFLKTIFVSITLSIYTIVVKAYCSSLNEQGKNVRGKGASMERPSALHFFITFEPFELEKPAWSQIDRHSM